jgi:GntR family transcriptional regulator
MCANVLYSYYNMSDASNTKALFQLNPSDPTPIYAQLDRGIRLGISIGRLRPDTQLPTVRQLAVDLCINCNTVAKVYRDLERAGILETRRGIGTFIKASAPKAMPRGERDKLLSVLADRFLAEAAAMGFNADQLLAYLVNRLGKGRQEYVTANKSKD